VGGVLEIARHGESALVVPPRDAAALGNALALLAEQPDLAARLAEGGRRVAARYGIDRMVEGTLEAYLGAWPVAVAEGGPARAARAGET
jgi:glycosyltransferase involved in cell wall biosynthesis